MMRGSKGTIIVFAIVGLLKFEEISAIQNREVYEITCPKVIGEPEENILLAHETDCSKFYQCSFGVAYEYTCPSDLHFNSETKRCEWPEDANCNINPTTCPIVEENPPEDILLPHETNCTKFYKCSFGEKVEIDCPDGLHYNPKKRYCDWPRNVKCKLGNGNSTTAEESCSLSQEDQLFPHKTDCNKYYQCNSKKKVERSCPKDLHFNLETSKCDWPENAKCQPGVDPPNEGTCSFEEEGKYYPHKSDCNKFYQCSLEIKIERNCPKELHFNPEANRCDWPENANCEPVVDPPKNGTCSPEEEGNLYPHKSYCNKYYQCNFKKKVERTCPEGLHFNPKANRCDWPKNAKCQPGVDPPKEGACSAEEEGKYYPHKSDCNKFYQCSLETKIERTCPKDLHFNPEANRCDWPENAKCEPVVDPPKNGTCSAEEEGNLYPHKSDCNKYYQCNFKKKVERNCPKGLHFNLKANRCDWPENANCEPVVDPPKNGTCSAEEEGNLYPHKSDCNKFYQCNFKKKVERTCPKGLHFNPKANRCDWPENANCEPVVDPPKNGTCSAEEEGNLYPHKSDCNKYYQCNFKNKVERTCPEGLHFNPKANRCDWPENAKCEPLVDPPKNGTCSAEEEGNLYPHKSDCNKYYQCNFKNKVEHTCPEGLHFNPKANRCDWPENAKCEPVVDPPKNGTCSAEEEGNLYPHKSDCNKYYQCNFKKKVERTCPEGLHFNPKANRCDWPENAKCAPVVDPPKNGTCSAEEEGNLYPHKSDCNKFYQCNFKKKVERTCPKGLHFNPKSNRCDWPENANCEPVVDPPKNGTCSAEEEGNLYPHKSDCNKFYQCNFKKKVERTCPKGLHFNPKANRCDWPENAKCEPVVDPPKNGTCSAEEEGNLYPHKSDCNKYYQCNFKKKVERTCPEGLHFNPKANRCDWPANAKCEPVVDPPKNGTCSAEEEGNLYPHKSDCNKYYQCNFKKKVERTCPKDLHFNPKANRCDWPENAKCEPVVNPPKNGTCSAEEEGNLYPHKSDCNKFYQCNFKKKLERTCPKGLHFNPKTNRCDWPESAKCLHYLNCPSEGKCTVEEEGKLFPHESDCNKYYTCNSEQKVERSCRKDLHFSAKGSKCSWPEEAQCEPGVEPPSGGTCSVEEEGQLYPHKYDCNKYYQCNFGKKVERTCQKYLQFNANSSRCDWAENAKCKPLIDPELEGTCSTEEEGKLYSHKYYCYKYYQCNLRKKVERTCPKDLHFNSKTSSCDWPENAECKLGIDPPSGGTCSAEEEGKMYPHKSECNKYYQCFSKKKVERSCRKDLHFNAIERRCDWPEDAKCRTDVDPSSQETCSAKEEGNLYPHKYDCNKFLQCMFGEKVEYSCLANLHFNTEKKICDLPYNANCKIDLNITSCPIAEEDPEEDILLPHESDCSKFYKCSFGEKVPMDCQNGLHYNPKKGYCDWPRNAKCKLGKDPPPRETCAAKEEGNLYPHKYDCNKFLQCMFGEKVEYSCLANLHFNAEKKICDLPYNANCKIDLNITSCPIVEEDPEKDILLPHESDCSKFYKCSFGRKVLISCPSGLHYNVAKRYCDWPRFAKCDPNWGPENSTEPGSCPNFEDDPRIDILLPHESDCNLFYKCNFGKKVLMVCPDDLHFNVAEQQCDYPDKANCNITVPSSALEHFKNVKEWRNVQNFGNSCPSVEEDPEEDILLPHEFDCSKFYKCTLGNKIEQDCPEGLYFNQVTNCCDWPENVECSQLSFYFGKGYLYNN